MVDTVGEMEIEIRVKLDKFDRDLQSANTKLDNFAKSTEKASGVSKALEEATSGISRQLLAASEGLGLFGQVLASTSPAGLVAAAAIGAIGEAFADVTRE